MRTPESFEKAEVCKYLDSIPSCWYFKPFMAGYGKTGVGDIIACIDGSFWNIEIKREGKSPTALQQFRIVEIKKSGGQATWGVAAKVCADINRWRKAKKEQATLGL